MIPARAGWTRTQEELVEIKVGIQHVNREVVLEITQTAAEIEKAVATAFDATDPAKALLQLTDEHGRKVIIPTEKIGYIDIGEENGRRVGFGAV
jgi:hypothetical protein